MVGLTGVQLAVACHASFHPSARVDSNQGHHANSQFQHLSRQTPACSASFCIPQVADRSVHRSVDRGAALSTDPYGE